MFKNLLLKTGQLSQQYAYWLMYILAGVMALSVALYHQHYLDEPPCVVCIQIRLWFVILILFSIAGYYMRGNRITRSLANLSIVLIAVAMVERSYLLLGTERGFIFSDCGFSLGLPAWFDIENWIPWLFRIETSCGYTPEVAFGVTMAEALIVSSVVFFLLSFYVFITDLMYARNSA